MQTTSNGRSLSTRVDGSATWSLKNSDLGALRESRPIPPVTTAILPSSFLVICLSRLLLSWNSPAPMLHARSLESEHRLAEVIGQMVRAAQQDGEAIARSIFGEIFFRYSRVPLDPVGPRHCFKPLPQFSINGVPCPVNLFVRRNAGSRLVGIRDEGDIKLGMKSSSQAQQRQHRVMYGCEMPP